jgi:hypothetical protein
MKPVIGFCASPKVGEARSTLRNHVPVPFMSRAFAVHQRSPRFGGRHHSLFALRSRVFPSV